MMLAIPMSTAGAQNSDSGSDRRTVLDGVYTEEQAFRGESAYQSSCSVCHDGGAFPALYGGVFMDNWREDELDTLLRFTQNTMPPATPDTLGEDAYADIIAYVLWLNRFPYGTYDLNLEESAEIRLIGFDGPQPLPNLTLIQTVGCLTPGPDTEWMLTTSSDPTRIRDALGPVTPEEIQLAESTRLGTLGFELRNLASVRPGLDPAAYIGRKVQVKGVLVRRPAGESINTMSFDPVSTTCSQ